MTEATPDAVDPRFDPRFQRGYDPEQHGGGERHGGGRRSALRADPSASTVSSATETTARATDLRAPRAAVSTPEHPYARPSRQPSVEASRPKPDVTDIPRADATDHASAHAVEQRAEDDEFFAPRGLNPFLIALGVVSLLMVGAGVAIFSARPESNLGLNGLSFGDSLLQYLTYGAIQPILSAGLVGVLLVLGVLAMRAPR